MFIFCLLQAHAASAVLNFSENCTPDILTPYLDVIVTKLLVLLQVCNHAPLQPHLELVHTFLCFTI
jgi:hypothetical protein